jgi:hypothetical protein
VVASDSVRPVTLAELVATLSLVADLGMGRPMERVLRDAETYQGDPGFLAGRGVDIVLLDDPGCVAAMREFQQRSPQVWGEGIGGRCRGPGPG